MREWPDDVDQAAKAVDKATKAAAKAARRLEEEKVRADRHWAECVRLRTERDGMREEVGVLRIFLADVKGQRKRLRTAYPSDRDRVNRATFPSHGEE